MSKIQYGYWGMTLVLVGGLLMPQGVWADPKDKSGDTLLTATPANLMRDMRTDRPDQTESPYTVDAGHIQVEMDVLNGRWDGARANDRDRDRDVQSFVVGNVNLKIGLTNAIDLQFVSALWTTSRTADRISDTTTEASGMGELTTRLKINLWGNDGGDDAFAIMPYVKWPLPASDLRNGHTEVGVILPYSMALSETLGLGVMAQVDYVNTEGETMQTQYFTTATLGQSFSDELGAYLELASRFIPDAESQIQLDCGVTYRPTASIQWDLGANMGLTRDAPDLVVFGGLTLRY